MTPLKTRRQFLGEASCASIGSASVLSSILNLKMANNAAAASLDNSGDCKSLVCILLAGGNDTFNMLVRRDEGYAQYSAARSNLALSNTGTTNRLIDLNQATGGDGNEYGVHPSCQNIANMFNGTGSFSSGPKLSFIANIGTLIQPTTAAQFRNNQVPVPKSLFSHIDQITQWQTSVPQGQSVLSGWAGRMADVLNDGFNTGQTSMSISLAGNNTFQIGEETTQFSITESGGLLLSGNQASLNNTTGRKNFGSESLLSAAYNNLVQDAFAKHSKRSLDAQMAFNAVFNSIDDSAVRALFNQIPNSNSALGRQLAAVARTIKARDMLGLRRSTFFVERGGWDHHGELLNTQAAMLTELSAAIELYQRALTIYGVADDVISYTASDFGRTLRSNGRGTDHAWGGNQMVFGNPIDGGKVFGTFPDLTLNGDDDIGFGGRFAPSTSIDKFFEEMALWFGVSTAQIGDVLPNLGNFSTEPDIGFIA